MTTPVVRLGAWCDFETDEDVRQRFLASPVDEPEDVDGPTAAGEHFRYSRLTEPPVLDPNAIHVRVEEFAVLADGRRLRLHADRGFTQSAELGPGATAGADPWHGVTREDLERDVRSVVLPDDAEETGEEHPWEWLSSLLRVQGVAASADELRPLPYDVEFSDRLRARMSAEG